MDFGLNGITAFLLGISTQLLEYLSEREKWFFSLGFIIPDALCMLITRIFVITSEVQLDGLLVVMYAIYLGWLEILVTLTLVTSCSCAKSAMI